MIDLLRFVIARGGGVTDWVLLGKFSSEVVNQAYQDLYLSRYFVAKTMGAWAITAKGRRKAGSS